MKNLLITGLITTAMGLYSLSAQALTLPEEARVPGGIALIPLTGLSAAKKPAGWYKGNRVMIVSSKNTPLADKAHWVAIAGIPLKASAKKQQHLRANATSYYFDIKDKEYRAQYLTVKNKRHVNPNPDDIARWRREKAEMVAAFKNWSNPAQPVTQFVLPAKGPFSSPFGLKRFFNKQPRNPHSGLDIAAPTGTPITAPAPGTVVAVNNYFFNGNTVILDHGNGLTSLYCHMSKTDVKLGDKLKLGDSIGQVGKTGRVTGPHLHWTVSLNNTRVDPLLFVEGK